MTYKTYRTRPSGRAGWGITAKPNRFSYYYITILGFSLLGFAVAVAGAPPVEPAPPRPNRSAAAVDPTSQTLVLPHAPGLPSGWEPLLDKLRRNRPSSGEASGLYGWSVSQLLPSIRERARSIERLARRRELEEAKGNASDLHRLALHLIDRLATESPPADSATFDKALRIEVLVQSLEQSCGGENPGRAPIYAHEIARIAADMLSPKKSAPPKVPSE